MPDFTVPRWVKNALFNYDSLEQIDPRIISEIKENLAVRTSGQPEVSVVIPAWNEEKLLARTLYLLSKQKTRYTFEVLVVNNNSSDKTAELAGLCGARVVTELQQGISYARQCGLMHAGGKYILNADADTLYPEEWIEYLVNGLNKKGISCVQSLYSLIPAEGNSRIALAFYEMLSGILFRLRRRRRGYLNVMGFNFGFRKEDGLAAGGFNTTRKLWSDGWMAMQLLEKGRIEVVTSRKARVWTSSRRLLADGSMGKAFIRRMKKETMRLKEYIFPVPVKK